MSFSSYPFVQADFYKSQVREIIKKEQELTKEQFKQYESIFFPHQISQYKKIKNGQGLIFREYKETTQPNVSTGYYKPVKESCTQITGLVKPEENSSALFNNLTRRKSLVKDY